MIDFEGFWMQKGKTQVILERNSALAEVERLKKHCEAYKKALKPKNSEKKRRDSHA